MAELFYYSCDECGGPTVHYDYVHGSSICGHCQVKKHSAESKAKKMIGDWKRKENEPT